MFWNYALPQSPTALLYILIVRDIHPEMSLPSFRIFPRSLAFFPYL